MTETGREPNPLAQRRQRVPLPPYPVSKWRNVSSDWSLRRPPQDYPFGDDVLHGGSSRASSRRIRSRDYVADAGRASGKKATSRSVTLHSQGHEIVAQIVEARGTPLVVMNICSLE